jgi:DNA-binding response OmpR family regulator
LRASRGRAGRVKTREALLDEIRDRNYDVFRPLDRRPHFLAAQKSSAKMPRTPRYIRTVRSAGYMMVGPE